LTSGGGAPGARFARIVTADLPDVVSAPGAVGVQLERRSRRQIVAGKPFPFRRPAAMVAGIVAPVQALAIAPVRVCRIARGSAGRICMAKGVGRMRRDRLTKGLSGMCADSCR